MAVATAASTTVTSEASARNRSARLDGRFDLLAGVLLVAHHGLRSSRGSTFCAERADGGFVAGEELAVRHTAPRPQHVHRRDVGEIHQQRRRERS